jgi:hypothetical protein
MTAPQPGTDSPATPTPANAGYRLVIAALLLGAIAACIGLRLWMWHYHPPRGLTMDEQLYLHTTQWFFDTGEIDTIARGPAYPVMLAFLFRILPLDLLSTIYAAQIAMSAACCGMLFWLGRRYHNAAVGLIAAWLMAIDLTMAAYSLFIFNELFFVFLAMAGAIVFLTGLDCRCWGRIAVAGGLFGLATLTKGQIVLIAPVLLLWVVLAFRRTRPAQSAAPTGKKAREADHTKTDGESRVEAKSSNGISTLKTPWSRAVLPGVALTVCWLAVVLPWTARNHFKYGKPILVDTTAARTLWHANQIPFRVSYSWPFGKYVQNPINGPLPAEDDRAVDEYAEIMDRQLDFVAKNPGLIIGRMPQKIGALLNPTSFFQLSMWNYGMAGWKQKSDAAVRVSAIATLLWGLTLFPAAIGLLAGPYDNRLWRFMALNIAMTLAVHSIMVSQSRYRISIMPWLFLLAAAALCQPRRYLNWRRIGSYLGAAAVVLLAWGWIRYWPFVMQNENGMKAASKLDLDTKPTARRAATTDPRTNRPYSAAGDAE